MINTHPNNLLEEWLYISQRSIDIYKEKKSAGILMTKYNKNLFSQIHKIEA